MNKNAILFFLSLVLLAAGPDSVAQVTRDSLFSSILNEERKVQIVLPVNTSQGQATTYDVMYLIDGESTTGMMTQIATLLQHWDFAPSLILVGVENKENWRRRDLTPTKSGSPSGGADRFLNFFQKELIPFINKKYPTNGSNTLFGHSYGACLRCMPC